jgi:predicted amidohydrolase
MNPVSRYIAVAIQTDYGDASEWETVEKNMKNCGRLIDWAMLSYSSLGFPIKLVAFPEFFIQGIPYTTKNALLHHRIPVKIPGDVTDYFQKIAQKYDIYIAAGSLLEYDEKYPGHVFNTACIVGPEGVVLKYRKVQPWLPLEPFTSPHDIEGYDEPLFPVADTPIGKLALGICYDFMFPEMPREYAAKGAEVLIRPTAYMPPWGHEYPTNWLDIVTQVRAIENTCYHICINLGAPSCGLMYNGGTLITDFAGRILAKTEHRGEQLLIAPINLDDLRQFRANAYMHNFIPHIRTEAYSYLKNPIYPGGSLKRDEANSFDHRQALIKQAREQTYPELENYKLPETPIGPNLVFPKMPPKSD